MSKLEFLLRLSAILHLKDNQNGPQVATLCLSYHNVTVGTSYICLIRFPNRARLVTELPGNVEQQSWSFDGKYILLTVAGRHADSSGVSGGNTYSCDNNSVEFWAPLIEPAADKDGYCSVWTYELCSGKCKRASAESLNVWCAAWIAGSTAIAGICSDLPVEEHWYRATLRTMTLDGSQISQVVFDNGVPLGNLATCPNDQNGAEPRVKTRQEMVLSWSADHRVLDGATVAKCANFVSQLLEDIDRVTLHLK